MKKENYAIESIYNNLELCSADLKGEKEFEIMVDTENYDLRGKVEYTKEELEEYAKLFNDNIVGHELALYKGHEGSHRSDREAIGWILPNSAKVGKSIKSPGHNSLFVKLKDPTPELEKYADEKRFKYFSAELFKNFKKRVDGKLKTYKRVLYGLALTNTPAIRGAVEAFSISHNSKNMELLTTYLEMLSAKEIVTKQEKLNMTKMIETLSTEESDEIKDSVKAINEKPEEEKKEESKENEEEKKEEVKEESKEPATENNAAQVQIEAMSAQIEMLESKVRREDLSKKVDTMLLSVNGSGILPKNKDAMIDLFMSCDDGQIEKFSSIFEDFRNVSLKENGISLTKKLDTYSTETKAGMNAIKAYAKENKLSYPEATKQLRKENLL